MATMDEQLAVGTIPAAYLEDVRQALTDEIEMDSGALTTNQAALVARASDNNRSDRDASVAILSRDLQLLSQLLGATDDTSVTAQPHVLAEAMQATVRVLNRRLQDLCVYAPLPMGDVVELSARLRWAADEAIRLCPELDHRLSDGLAR